MLLERSMNFLCSKLSSIVDGTATGTGSTNASTLNIVSESAAGYGNV